VSNLFVGRQNHLIQMIAGFGEASAGNFRLFVLEGERGVGKTRLAREFAVHAARLGAPVLWVVCGATAADRTAAGSFEIFTQSSVTDGGPGPLAEFLTLALNGDSGRDGGGFGPGHNGSSSGAEKRAIGLAMHACAARAPVVIVDDLSANRGFSRMISCLHRVLRVSGGQIVVIFDEDSDSISSLLASVVALDISVTRLRLHPLSEADVGQLVAGHDKQVPANELVQRLYEVSRGNPLILDHLLAILPGLEAPPRPRSIPAASFDLQPSTAPASDDRAFIREGDYWTIAFEGKTIRMRHSKGAYYVHRLLSHPGEEIHAAQLCAQADRPTRSKSASFGHDREQDEFFPLSDAGPVLDEQAKASFLTRLRELRAECEEARANADLGMVERLSKESDLVERHLTASVGLGGRDRRACSDTERARVRVTHAVRSLIRRIQKSHVELAAYLHATVRTGTFCSYVPFPPSGKPWLLRCV
jgi:hypothetical protein